MTPMVTSATSGATLTTPLLETVTVCSEAVVVGSAAMVGWPLMIGPRMRPITRLAAAVTAIARPMVVGPMRLVPMLCWGVVFDAWSFIVVSVVACGPHSAWYMRRTPAAPSWFPLATIADMSATETNPWRRVSRRVAYENPWLDLYHDDVIRPDGQPDIYGVVHFRHRAIGVVPLDVERDAVLLVGQYRYTLDHYS